MIKIKVGDLELDMASCWDDLYWDKYVQILKLENNKSKYISNLLYTQKFISILCGVDESVIDEMEIEQLYKLEEIIMEGFNPQELEDHKILVDHFVINGIVYSFYSQNTINKITLGEQAYIETMKTMHDPEDLDYIIKELAVLIRPATKIINKEGMEMWKLDKFDAEEVEHRANILKNSLSIKDILKINNFFLSSASL